MTEQERDKNITGHDPNREHMTLSALWNLWMDNLKSWRQFGEEHADLFTLNIQAGFRRIGDWLGRVRRSARTLAAAASPMATARNATGGSFSFAK